MSNPTPVILTRNVPTPVLDKNVAVYNAIRNSTENLSFDTYSAFIAALFCRDTKTWQRFMATRFRISSEEGWTEFQALVGALKTSSLDCLGGTRAYDVLHRATEAFVTLLAAPPETCRCFTGREIPREGEEPSDLAAIREAKRIADETNKTYEDDVADINRRYAPQDITVGQFRQLIRELLGTDDGPWDRKPDIKKVDDDTEVGFETTGPLLPFVRRLRQNLRGVALKGTAGDDCSGVLGWKLECPPFLELIWSYWMEQGMLVQGINALAMRFQNQRRGPQDPLTRLDITWLRPLNGLLWGYIQKEQDRLSVVRRAYEYDHHYGLRLHGKAVPVLQSADSRPRFLEAFHNLLIEATRFYRLSTNTTLNPDAFPVLNALRDLHLILSEGAANQFGDLPATARQEMLIQQWLIGRPEMRDFLGGRPGVVYPESWMGHMDTLRQIFGWNDASIRHYRDLAVHGERLLLSVRWVDWTNINDDFYAVSWLTYFRTEIHSYVHSYRAVTGIDLNTEEVAVRQRPLLSAQPSDLILQRRAAPALTPAPTPLPTPVVPTPVR